MKSSLFSLLLLLGFALVSQAQDKIIKRNGAVIEGKVTEVGVKEVKYQIDPEPNSARFVIRKAELSHIVFGNGEIYSISDRPVAKQTPAPGRSSFTDYGKNILTISPFKALDSGAGLGFSYERILGSRQNLGLIFPVSFIFNNFSLYDPYYGSGNKYRTNFYFSPGLKIYPFGQRKVTYAVGPNIMMGVVKSNNNDYVYSPTGAYNYPREETNFRLGLVVNNYLNFQITSHINLGINGGLGMRYFDKQNSSSNFLTSRDGMRIIGEFAFNFGLRF